MSISISGNAAWGIMAAIIAGKLAWHLIDGAVVMCRDSWAKAKEGRA